MSLIIILHIGTEIQKDMGICQRSHRKPEAGPDLTLLESMSRTLKTRASFFPRTSSDCNAPKAGWGWEAVLKLQEQPGGQCFLSSELASLNVAITIEKRNAWQWSKGAQVPFWGGYFTYAWLYHHAVAIHTSKKSFMPPHVLGLPRMSDTLFQKCSRSSNTCYSAGIPAFLLPTK